MLYLYAIMSKNMGKIAIQNAKGCNYYTRKAAAIRKAEGCSDLYVMRYRLERIPNGSKQPGMKLCYQTVYEPRIYYRKDKRWNDSEYATYVIVKDGIVYEVMD